MTASLSCMMTPTQVGRREEKRIFIESVGAESVSLEIMREIYEGRTDTSAPQ